MLFKGEGAITYASDSRDLRKWTLIKTPAIDGAPHEGPNVFEYILYQSLKM